MRVCHTLYWCRPTHLHRYELFLRTYERLMIWQAGVHRCLANPDALCMQAHCLRHLRIELCKLRIFGSLALSLVPPM